MAKRKVKASKRRTRRVKPRTVRRAKAPSRPRGSSSKLSTEEKWAAFFIIIIFLGFLYYFVLL